MFLSVLIRRAAVLLIGLGLPMSAIAAEVGTGPCPTANMRIVVLGDSLADGLWGSLYRNFARCQSIETLRLTVVSDGLAKSSSEDWLERYATATTALNTHESDVIVVQMGANDITTIRDGRSRLSFSTPEWDKAYSDRVTQLTEGLRAKSAKVIWFGLPVVGKSDLETPYQTITALQYRAALDAGAEWIDTHDLTKFGTGDFAMNGSFGGKLQQLRASDKVHFTKSGYDFVAGEVIDDLTRIIASKNRKATLQNVQLQ
jgi:hypothetical protein